MAFLFQVQLLSPLLLPLVQKPPHWLIKENKEYNQIFATIIIAFIIAISLLFLLMRFKAEFILKLWFFIVVVIALGISFNSIIPAFQYATIMAVVIALPLAFINEQCSRSNLILL